MLYVPSLAEIRAEIEMGPLANDLAPYWTTVFVAPATAKPDPAVEITPEAKDRAKAAIGAWEVKTRRAGLLHPDAAFEIHRRLTTGIPNTKDVKAVPSRAEELEWTGLTPKLIKYAKQEATK